MAITIENIKKSFGEVSVLKGISCEFNSGSVNMIIGASGCGKTVLLKCIVGLIKFDEGDVFFDNRNFKSLSTKELRILRQEIGMLFQSSALFDSQTIFENVSFPMRMFTNATSKEISIRVAECLENVNLAEAAKKYPSELSGGMKKRAALARAIVLNPKFLFCDEPNSGLDPTTASVIDRLIADLTIRYNTTTLVISHDIKSVLSIGDKIIFIHKGFKEWEGHRTDVMKSDNIPLKSFVEPLLV